jgi:hypothetical protein
VDGAAVEGRAGAYLCFGSGSVLGSGGFVAGCCGELSNVDLSEDAVGDWGGWVYGRTVLFEFLLSEGGVGVSDGDFYLWWVITFFSSSFLALLMNAGLRVTDVVDDAGLRVTDVVDM